jgi:hypothetical protein
MTPEQMKALNIPEEYHTERIFLDAPDLPTVFKVARDLNTYKGNSIRVPGPEAAEAEKKEFADKLKKHAPSLVEIPTEEDKREAALLERLGVPKEEKEYAATDLPEDVLTRLRKEAKEEGLTKRQFEKRVAREKATIEGRTKSEGEALAALKKELGNSFEEHLTSAAAAAKRLGATPEEVEAIRTGKVPVATAKQYLNAAKALGTEPGDLGSVTASGPARVTREEAQNRINEIYKNPDFLNKSAPGHKDLVEKLYSYNEIIHPDEG